LGYFSWQDKKSNQLPGCPRLQQYFWISQTAQKGTPNTPSNPGKQQIQGCDDFIALTWYRQKQKTRRSGFFVLKPA